MPIDTKDLEKLGFVQTDNPIDLYTLEISGNMKIAITRIRNDTEVCLILPEEAGRVFFGVDNIEEIKTISECIMGFESKFE